MKKCCTTATLQVGGNARKTNKDYTAGTLPELVDIIIEEKARRTVVARRRVHPRPLQVCRVFLHFLYEEDGDFQDRQYRQWPAW